MEGHQTPEQVRIQFQLTQEEYVRGMRFYLRKSHTVSLVALVLLLVALGAAIRRPTFLSVLAAVLGVLLAGYWGFLYGYAPGRAFRRDPALGQRILYCFTREDYARQDDRGAGVYDWDLKALWRGKEFYYLFPKEGGGFALLPRRAFPPEAELGFEAILKAACPEAKWRELDGNRSRG